MSLWKKITAELVDIIEWTDDTQNTMVWRFDRYQNEIKYGAKLTVRESQLAVFVNEGQIADVFKPGLYTLTTKNMPVLTTLKGWYYGFDSPFKAEVYFINTKNFTDLKWGTKNPVMLRDAEFGPVRMRAFGSYVVKVTDPSVLIKEIAGTDGHFTTDEIQNQLRNLIVTRFADLLGESNIPVLDLAANYNELSAFMEANIANEFSEYGISITKFLVENITLPPDVEEALDKKTSMGVIGDLTKYTQFQSANAMEDAARNPGGDASAGVGMGMGFAMANQMGKTLADIQPADTQTAPPPLPENPPTEYYIGLGGEQKGPFVLNILEQMIQDKTIDKQTLVWARGMEKWGKAGEQAALKTLFEQIPPPLPK